MLFIGLFISLLWASTGVNAIYFHLTDPKPLCFIQDVPDDTLVKGDYKLLGFQGKKFEKNPSINMLVHITDPDENPFHSRSYSNEGQFVFTSNKGGEHRICVSSDNAHWGNVKQVRVHLDLWTDDHAINYGEVAVRDRLNDLQLRVRQLSDQVQAISKDQNYQRVREEYFRQLSEKTSEHVTYWSIGQLVLLGAIGFWQMRHLRAFFQAKKLV